MTPIALDIPFRSQWADDARSHKPDCGPTCVAMLLNACGTPITPDGVYTHLPAKAADEYVHLQELIDVLKAHNLAVRFQQYASADAARAGLQAQLAAGYAPIVLVNYAAWQAATGNPFAWGHYVLVTGLSAQEVYCHDPLFGMWQPAAYGRHLPLAHDLFLAGWGGFAAGQNPNFSAIWAERALPRLAQLPARPRPGQPPDGLTEAQYRRICAVCAYHGQPDPLIDTPALVAQWLAYLGDWGAQTHALRVKAGDTLAGLALAHYGNGSRWRAIQRFNELPRDWLTLGQSLSVPLPGTTQGYCHPPAWLDLIKDLTPPADQPAIDLDSIGRNSIAIGFLNNRKIRR